MSKGTYYVGRINKGGRLDNKNLLKAIINSTEITHGLFKWSITNIEEGEVDEGPYVFGFLSKYYLEGPIKIVNEEEKNQEEYSATNLLRASSPFVYLPDYAGIAYLHVWDGILNETFRSRFQQIIKETFGNFFVDFTIEPIIDYRTFVQKIIGLDSIQSINATVRPPNPSFGRLWKNLNDYIMERNAREVNISEKGRGIEGIKSKIADLLLRIIANKLYEPDIPPDIADAALLMAADGYGHGTIKGYDGNSIRTIRTRENQESFPFDKDPVPSELASRSAYVFEKISKKSGMRHED